MLKLHVMHEFCLLKENCYICNELGGLKDFRNNDYYRLVIFVDVDVKDSEIKDLVDQLPKFKDCF